MASKPDERVEDLGDGEHPKRTDDFEAIDVQGQEKTGGVWVHRPGTDVCQKWKPRKGRVRQPETQVLRREITNNKSPTPSPSSGSHDSDSDSDATTTEGKKVRLKGFKKGLHKLGSMFHRSPKQQSPKQQSLKDNQKEAACAPTIPHANIPPVGEKRTSVKIVVSDKYEEKSLEPGEGNSRMDEVDSPGKSSSVQTPKNLMSKSFKSMLSRKDSSRLQVSGGEDIDALVDDQLVIPGSPINSIQSTDKDNVRANAA